MNKTNPKQAYVEVLETLADQTSGKRKKFRKATLNILRNARRNKKNIIFAIFSLTIIFPELRSDERRDEVYKILAQKLSTCSKEEHLDFVEYLLINSYDSVLKAMCWVLQYEWQTENHDEECIQAQREILRSANVEHYFDFQFKI